MADATSLSYVYTVGGYAALIGIGYTLYAYSAQNARRRAGATQPRPARSSQPEPRKEEKKKKQRVSSPRQAPVSSEKSSQPKARARAQAETPETGAYTTSAQTETADDGIDNTEFAKQLSMAKQGKQFAKDTDSAKKQKEKSVKQSRANQIDSRAANKTPEVSATPPPLTNGADADDDGLSSEQPPEAKSVDAAGIADMLEPAPTGPSVLRLTDTEVKTKGKSKAKAPEPVETKKQRQNRKKAEAARAAREEAEKERKVLEERQRRAARIAEGRAARDGSQYTNASTKKSAWSQGAPNGDGSGSSTTVPTNGTHQLLDTFDEPPAKEQTTKPAVAPKSESGWMSSLPSEEEQMEMLKNDADEWSTVKTKSKKSPKKDVPATLADDGPVPTVPAAQTVVRAAGNANQGSTKSASAQNFGPFSALAAKGDASGEGDEEEEWDV